jgi:hypothetical protein
VARNLPAGLQTAFTAKRLAPVLFVDIQFTSGIVRLWSGVGSIVWGGFTWLGITTPQGQTLGGISAISERSDVQAQAAAFSLSGIPVTAVQQVLNECRQSFPANIYIAAVDLYSGALLATPYKSWGGYTDVPTIAADGQTCTVTISVETRLVDLQRAPEWTYTHSDQQIFSPGDDGFKFVAGLQNTTVNWGKANPIAGGPTVGGNNAAGVGRGGGIMDQTA